MDALIMKQLADEHSDLTGAQLVEPEPVLLNRENLTAARMFGYVVTNEDGVTEVIESPLMVSEN
jgi:hypothetical protein